MIEKFLIAAIILIFIGAWIGERRIENEAWKNMKIIRQQVRRERLRANIHHRADYVEIGVYPVRRWFR